MSQGQRHKAAIQRQAQERADAQAITPAMLEGMKARFISLETRLTVCANALELRDKAVRAELPLEPEDDLIHQWRAIRTFV